MRIYYFSCLLLLLIHHSVLAQCGTSQDGIKEKLRVDSVFTTNFTRIENKILQKKPLSSHDECFIYVASSFSRIEHGDVHCFGSLIVKKGKLRAYQKWYDEHKEQIEWQKLARAFQLLDLPLTDETAAELASLRIK